MEKQRKNAQEKKIIAQVTGYKVLFRSLNFGFYSILLVISIFMTIQNECNINSRVR